MKNYLFVLALIAATANTRGADTIAQWNFNSVPPDASASTGSTNASLGSGSVGVIGGTTYTFVGGYTADPAAADNSAINVSTYPPSTAANRSGGIRFRASTVGYSNVTVSWAQRQSATASRYHRLQYSINGTDFVDMPDAFAVAYPNSQSASLIFTNLSADLSGIEGVAENPDFAFQIVSEFASTAAGGSESYVGAADGSTYSSAGTVRLELMTISGDASGAQNAAPTITAITNVSMRADTTYPAIPFTIGDAETPASLLLLNKSSSDPSLLADINIELDGTESNRTVLLTPAANQTGIAIVTLTVVDEGGKSNSVFFAVTVIPTNTPPTISAILNQGTVRDTPTSAIPFTIGDAETEANNLTVLAVSANATLLPQGGVVLGGSNQNRTITLTPAPGQAGNALVSISVDDGVLTTNRTFVLSVLPSAGTLLYEPFDYPDGALLTNSLGLWQNHGGNAEELDTANQMLYVTADNSEDVSTRLRGEPYTPASGTRLYYSFRFSAYNLPTSLGDYFAHFKDNGNNFRARLFVSTTNAPLGSYRIGIANGASFATNAGYAEVPIDVTFDETNLIVVRYNVGAGVSTLWLNPATESDSNYIASDPIGSTNNVTQFAIRETRFQGDLYVDDVRVATTFDEVLGRPPQNFRMRIAHGYLYWPTAASAAGFILEGTPDLSAPNWQTISPTGTEGDENVLNFSNPAGNAFFRLRK